MPFEKEDYDVLQERYEHILKKLDYIECDIGWFDIIDDVLKEALNIAFEEEEDLQIVQIKEKFGGLRVYYEADIEDEDRRRRLDDLIYRAESLSYKTCEVCGEEGKPRKGGWIKTLCNDHNTR